MEFFEEKLAHFQRSADHQQKSNSYQPHQKLFIFCLLISYLLFYSTGHTFEREKTGKNFRYSATVASFKANEKEKYRLKIIHPYSFDLKTIRKCLVSLAYQERIIQWSKKKRVFPSGTKKQLAPLIVEQFAQADKNQLVTFKVTDRSGNIKVKGDTFLTPEGIQWRIEYNTIRPHSSLGYRPPAPETFEPMPSVSAMLQLTA